jgi:hypothetical protein
MRKMKNYLKTGFLLLGILISTTNCEKDEFSIDSSQTTIDNKSLYDLPNIQSVKENFQNLNNFGNPFNSSVLLAKEKNNKYFIDWDNSKSINFKKKENINILYTPIIYNKNGKRNKSFIASVTNKNHEIESFMFSVFYDRLSTNEIFSGYISKFDSSGKPIELYKYENGLLKTTYTFKKEKNSGKKGYSYRDSDCGSSWEQIYSAINYLLEFGGAEETIYFGECVTISSSGGGGSDNWSNPDTNLSGGFIPMGVYYNNPTGGGGGSTSTSITTTNNVLTTPEGLQWWADESETLPINSLILKLQNPTNEQIQWINDPINSNDVSQLNNFLNANPYSLQSQNFAKETINISIGLNNFDNLIKSTIFNPLDTPWLNQIREFAKRIYIIKDYLSDELLEVLNKRIDNLFILALTKTALEINPEANTQKESNKDFEFKNNGKNGVGILLYEFANGQGPSKRDFYFSEHDFAKQFLSGDVPNDIKSDFLNVLEVKGLTFEQFVAQGKMIEGGYSFSPDHTSITDSFNKHLNANWVQFFIGGTKAEYRPSIDSGWIEVILENPTSRNSLLLHQAESYPRDIYGNVPLSTINQYFHFILKIQ